MKTSTKVFLGILSLAVVLALVIASVALVGGNQSQSAPLGAATPGTRFLHGITIGTSAYYATNLALVQAGTCSLVSDASILATTTGTGTCVTTGSLAGDVVIVSLATTTTKMAAQYSVIGTVAGTDSTTVRLLNLTGVTAVPSATNGLGSSTQFQVFRAQ